MPPHLFMSQSRSSPSDASILAYSDLDPGLNDEARVFRVPRRLRIVANDIHDKPVTRLPRLEADVHEVRWWLYQLLTLDQNRVAKKWPQWVIETCAAWHGSGEDLRALADAKEARFIPWHPHETHPAVEQRDKPEDRCSPKCYGLIEEVILGTVGRLAKEERKTQDSKETQHRNNSGRRSAMSFYPSHVESPASRPSSPAFQQHRWSRSLMNFTNTPLSGDAFPDTIRHPTSHHPLRSWSGSSMCTPSGSTSPYLEMAMNRDSPCHLSEMPAISMDGRGWSLDPHSTAPTSPPVSPIDVHELPGSLPNHSASTSQDSYGHHGRSLDYYKFFSPGDFRQPLREESGVSFTQPLSPQYYGLGADYFSQQATADSHASRSTTGSPSTYAQDSLTPLTREHLNHQVRPLHQHRVSAPMVLRAPPAVQHTRFGPSVIQLKNEERGRMERPMYGHAAACGPPQRCSSPLTLVQDADTAHKQAKPRSCSDNPLLYSVEGDMFQRRKSIASTQLIGPRSGPPRDRPGDALVGTLSRNMESPQRCPSRSESYQAQSSRSDSNDGQDSMRRPSTLSLRCQSTGSRTMSYPSSDTSTPRSGSLTPSMVLRKRHTIAESLKSRFSLRHKPSIPLVEESTGPSRSATTASADRSALEQGTYTASKARVSHTRSQTTGAEMQRMHGMVASSIRGDKSESIGSGVRVQSPSGKPYNTLYERIVEREMLDGKVQRGMYMKYGSKGAGG
ncbi:hypothetical protein BDV95DRAFT_218333 [Massariosphaeria phaeospora]|uniref:Uncharacterized protein n=1 Tax=Massariosphaeria phaeospora TaxID=100035 RepID=A0A7C8IH11_9PLEO|nr:hypothetical protein BDV95DRAFT_218333 [Massariosphaeria phaeospora]